MPPAFHRVEEEDDDDDERMQKTAGLTRVGSGRAIPSAGRGGPGGGRLSAANGFHLSNLNYDGKIAGLYDLEETLGMLGISNKLFLSLSFYMCLSLYFFRPQIGSKDLADGGT